MTGQREKPDFVVDPSGTAEDVRYSSQGFSGIPPDQPPGKGGDGQWGSRQSPSQPKKTIYFIPIPIGLIVFLVIALIRNLSPSDGDVQTFDSESAYRSYSLATRYFYSGEYDKALVHFNMALYSEPDVGQVYNGRGLVYRAMGEYDRALADFTKALELVPDSAMVYNNRAITYQDVGKHHQAIADLTRAIELEPNLGKAYYNRGLAYLALSDYDQVVADLTAAIACSSHWSPIPTSEAPESGLGLLSGFGEELEATRYAAPLPLAHYVRAVAYYALGAHSSAIADLEKALELDPGFSEAELALTLVEAGLSVPFSWTLPNPAPTETSGSAATAEAPVEEVATADPTRVQPAPVAVYVPQPQETPTTPIWESTPSSCSDEPLYLWSSPGTYIYRITDGSGAERVVMERQAGTRARASYPFSCDYPEVDITSLASNFGESFAEPPKPGSSTGMPACRPPQAVIAGYGTISTIVAGTETKRTQLGAFEAVRVDTNLKYSVTTGAHNTYEKTAEKSEWYACGYGLLHSTASLTEMANFGKVGQSTSQVTLISYTPSSTNESHVRYILADLSLSNNIDSYRSAIANEETAEALRRWDAGIRAVNADDFQRSVVDGRWQIVYSGTDIPIAGSDVILTTDASE